MVPALTALAQTPAKPPMRFGAVYFPNGATSKHWFPDASGPGFEYKPILKPLEPFRDRVNVFGNLSRAGGKTVTDHAVSSAGWLSGAVAKQTEAEDIQVGVSIDQVIAKQIGQDTRLPSMEVATEDFSGYVGGCVRLRLRLHEHDLVGVGDAVESDGDQSAHGVRADVRAARFFGGARGAHPRGSQHSRFGHRGSPRPAAQGRRARPHTHRRLSRSCARDRAPHPEDRAQNAKQC
jgi:hypothetical protein